MDIIASIKLIENTLGKRYPDQHRNQPASSKKYHSTQKNISQPGNRNLSAWDEIQPGRNIDTSA